MAHPQYKNFLAAAEEIFPDNKEVAILFAMNEITDQIKEHIRDCYMLCDMLEDSDEKNIIHKEISAIDVVFYHSMYLNIKNSYIEKENKYSNRYQNKKNIE